MTAHVRRLLSLLVALGLVAAAWAAGLRTQTQPAALFDADRYLSHVKYLASDELGGRGTGSEGIDKAAEYLAQQFQAVGCQPGVADGTWFQPFEVRSGKKLVDEEARLEVEGLDQQWKVRHDWIPFPFSELGEVEGPLAFAGYGIQASEFDYDDYADLDVQDKILLILRYEPKSDDAEAKFGGQTPSQHAMFVRKAQLASRNGARGLLIVNPPNRDPDNDELYGFTPWAAHQTFPLPMVHVKREVAAAILQKAGQPDLKTLAEQLDKDRKPLSRDLGLKMKLVTGVQPNVLPARNVLGLVRGHGDTPETIVVGAHYDHLGIEPHGTDPTPRIHNGADDNASGTAGVIELARAIAAGPPLRRNVLFIAFSAEELGLNGSRHFVSNPTVPLEHIKAMLNLDMIGRLSQKKCAVYGITTAEEFPAMAERTGVGLELGYKVAKGVPGNSDHGSFIKHHIPVLFPFTGVHKQYHQPEDDWELIDAEGATRVLQWSYRMIVELASLEQGPTFTEPPTELDEEDQLMKPAAEEAKQAAEQTGAASRPAETDQPSRGGVKVRFGIVPDMAGDEQPGLLIDTVLEGGSAKAAGLENGDRIIQIGPDEIRDIYAYMRALRQYNPGDEVDVTFMRKGEKKTVKVKLQASDYGRNKEPGPNK